MSKPTTSDMTVAEILTNIAYPLVGPRCKTHDKDDFPELKDEERCMVCAVYDEVDQALAAIEAHYAAKIKEAWMRGYAAGESSERLNNTEEV